MKNILRLATMMVILTGAFSCRTEAQNPSDVEETDFFYTDAGEKEFFKVRKDKLVLKCQSADDAKALCKESVFLSAYDVNYVWVIGTINPQKTTLDDLLKIPQVVDATYGLEYKDGTLHYPTDKIYVKFKDGKSPEGVIAESDLAENVVTIELVDEFHQGYLITLNAPLGNILQICRNLFESGLCNSASPSFIREAPMDNF
jgi:hypothetical protein